jgi:hypothetical protein
VKWGVLIIGVEQDVGVDGKHNGVSQSQFDELKVSLLIFHDRLFELFVVQALPAQPTRGGRCPACGLEIYIWVGILLEESLTGSTKGLSKRPLLAPSEAFEVFVKLFGHLNLSFDHGGKFTSPSIRCQLWGRIIAYRLTAYDRKAPE